ncbi:MAG: type III-B CRISPR-associated protein Cas10/Cmr2 [Burkholderiales bacterium]
MTDIWKRKLAAWVHDPAEKAMVLMRDTEDGVRIGHESGSVRHLREALGIDKGADFDKRADWFAAAADRPQWPFEEGKPRPAWANVRWTESPVIIHPLSGEKIPLTPVGDESAAAWRHLSLDHFTNLIEKDTSGRPDYRLTFLAFWRFGPELPADDAANFWRMLPADTRVPDHTIWQHLDVVSALAGALHDDTPALLTMALGPVQSFIAQARSTSDLWAGSHLLSCLAWEAMKPIVDALGPDAVLMPSLRNVPLVDLWLLEQARAAGADVGSKWWTRFCESEDPWTKSRSDANPLFSASLPSKFTVIVPRRRAADLARQATDAVREQARQWAESAAVQVFEKFGSGGDHWKRQIAEQIAGFPEVHWSVVDWPVASDNHLPDPSALRCALGQFHPEASASSPGFFGTEVWKTLSREAGVTLEGVKFFEPNSGLLYPAVYELAERGLAASKATRAFDALTQEGFRCTLTGESEWLTDTLDFNGRPADGLDVRYVPAAQRGSIQQDEHAGTLWTRVASTAPSWARRGEHLGALATLKRLWPTVFCGLVARVVPDLGLRRFVVSTHTLALATSFAKLAEDKPTWNANQREVADRLVGHARRLADDEPAALPRALLDAVRHDDSLLTLARGLPPLLDCLRDADDSQNANSPNGTCLRKIEDDLATLLGHRQETYFGVIMMDGDRMGAWLSGESAETSLPYKATWHPQVCTEVEKLAGSAGPLREYIDSRRPASPARHAFISGALNHFSLHVVRHIVEVIGKGRLVYAGGDDVLALVAVDDLLPTLMLLRAAYSGWGDVGATLKDRMRDLEIGRGYVKLHGRVFPAMGRRSTASAGAVVAHYSAPLARVLAAAHEAEQQAKHAGRNRFSLRVLKRGAGAVGLTATYWKVSTHGADHSINDDAVPPPPIEDAAGGVLMRLSDALANSFGQDGKEEFSRRAIYAATEWLSGLPPRPVGEDAEWGSMVTRSLEFQFQRQGGVRKLAAAAVKVACEETEGRRHETLDYLNNLLVTAEFFARPGRA